MMVSLGVYVRRWRRFLRRWMLDSRVHELLQGAAYIVCGFLFSAASLGGYPQPLAMALLMAVSGWPALLLAGGSAAGYWLFWGQSGGICCLWILLATVAVIVLGEKPLLRDTPFLMPALAGAMVAITGLLLQIWQGDSTPVGIYLLRILLAAAATRVFSLAMARQDPVVDWLVCGLGILALAQVMPIPYLGLGYIAAGALAVTWAFPAAALAGLALDLAEVTPIPMTAVICLAWLTRLIPGRWKWIRYAAAPAAMLLVMGICGVWDFYPLPGLALGSLAAVFLPGEPNISRRRGETGFAQVRLELAAGVLNQTELLLSEVQMPPIDEQALILRAVDRACSGCPCKKSCRENPAVIPGSILHKPLGNGGELPISCRKSGRLLQELRRSQEMFRGIRADRDRQQEYRDAVMQQYRFLSEYLQDLSDSLARRQTAPNQWYRPEIGTSTISCKKENGDRCLWFSGVECRYYLALCDGMGTGAEAARDGAVAGSMLRRLLSAGYPAEHALRSINNLCALRGCAGAVTIDLAELQLDTGKVILYKWGAAPSFLISGADIVKIGTATPPPGLSVTEGRESVERLSLRRGQTLVMLSDGAGGEEAVRRGWEAVGEPPEILADRILEAGPGDRSDDATVAVVRLQGISVPT